MEIAFILEQTLGHVTYSRNLKAVVDRDSSVAPRYIDLPYEQTPLPPGLLRAPVIRSDWALRASLAAARAMKPLQGRVQAAMYHTQTTSLLSSGFMRKVPSVISLDATPKQLVSFAAAYNAPLDTGYRARLKRRLYQHSFGAAKGFVVWSHWVKNSLAEDYGMARDKVAVIPPGIDLDRWRPAESRRQSDKECRLLFVGGDFHRKGGASLLEWIQNTRARGWRLDIVTQSKPDVSDPRVVVHNDITPNSPDLMALYAEADVFVMPTRADCYAIAGLEALASGIPVVIADTGGTSDIVREGINGFLVPPDDPDKLDSALTRL